MVQSLNIHPYFSDTNLNPCNICPRHCNAYRSVGQTGYCGAGGSSGVVSVCVHKGEEPCLSGESGICNVFFSKCNLRCIYCQNAQISAPELHCEIPELAYDEVVKHICICLDQGCTAVGFVSPSHQVPQMKHIIALLNECGRYPVIVYNSNGYDKLETLQSLEGIVDVYLPDFKYADDVLAKSFSGVTNYLQTATTAIKEMIRQKGRVLITNDKEEAVSGVIIRHLVLPGSINNSIGVLNIIAESFSPGMWVSLMAQYHPMPAVAAVPGLNRGLTASEYDRVINHREDLGMYNGYIQELESNTCYLPDFNELHPFEIKY
ncbi:MAG: hypothetical protein RBR28_01115 [Lentimicrobium sp.]|nr:hypothetical protein [Lentimicrobium sp.]